VVRNFFIANSTPGREGLGDANIGPSHLIKFSLFKLFVYEVVYVVCNRVLGRSQWPRGFRSLGRWDRGFESHSRNGCLYCVRLSCVCVVLSVQVHALRRADPPSKESY
jgi:hypothetical protein